MTEQVVVVLEETRTAGLPEPGPGKNETEEVRRSVHSSVKYRDGYNIATIAKVV